MPKFFIKHITEYKYSTTVIDGANQIMLYPIGDAFQEIKNHQLIISNNPKVITRNDFYYNTVGSFTFIEPHNSLSIISEIEIDTVQKPFPDNKKSIEEQWASLTPLKKNTAFIDYCNVTYFEGTSFIAQLIKDKSYIKGSVFNAVLDLSSYIFKNFKYIQGITHVDSKLNEVWKLKAGVCQDFTNILLQMVRMLGIPARYVSGYICPNTEGSRGEGATHAWIEAYIPFYGWLGFDPTNNTIANQYHVKLAVGPNYKDCAPVKGVYKGSAIDELFVKVIVSSEKVEKSLATKEADISKDTLPKNSYQKNLEALQQIRLYKSYRLHFFKRRNRS